MRLTLNSSSDVDKQTEDDNLQELKSTTSHFASRHVSASTPPAEAALAFLYLQAFQVISRDKRNKCAVKYVVARKVVSEIARYANGVFTLFVIRYLLNISERSFKHTHRLFTGVPRILQWRGFTWWEPGQRVGDGRPPL